MADLTFTAGPVSASVSATNAKARKVVDNFLEWLGEDLATMSDQEKADRFVGALVAYALKKGRGFREEQIRLSKSAEVASDLEAEGIEWS